MSVGEVLAGAARWHVEQGDCLDVLRAMPDASVDAVVTDPPAGIAFMGKGWDTDKGGRDAWIAWLAEIMREALRALKPGGHALVWALPRTSHWTATAVEDAGFEIRDVGVHLFGSGFPKSLDVSKAIDKAAGAERKVVGSRRLTGTARIVGGQGGATSGRSAEMYETHATRDTLDLTAPATPLAEQWSGWGTALKPASEHWILARKPLAGTVAANVAAHGTGAINVDACRIGTAADVPSVRAPRAADESGMNYGDGLRRAGDVVDWKPGAGRWPANVTLSHLPECREVGVRRVRRNLIDSRVRTDATERAPEWGTRAGSRSLGRTVETVPAFDCAPGCAVAALDEQSGERPAGVAVNRNRAPGTMTSWLGTRASQTGEDVGYGDTGGASRFFYVAKASRAERNAGLPPRGNKHPTVKPLALMRWLARLVAPPGGIVLDPFTGSGSTGAACALEGFRFMGIEREAEYVEIARARIAHWSAEAAKPAPKAKPPKPRAVPAPPPSSPRPADDRQTDLFDWRTA